MIVLKTMESKNIEKVSDENKEPEWLIDRRKVALELFKKKPMPDFIYGLNINLDIKLDLDDIGTNQLGRPARKIINKDNNVKIMGFNDALKNYEQLLKQKLMSCIEAKDKFTFFHQAFVNNILLIHIQKNTEIKEPIEIISKIGPKVLFDHLIIVAEDNSKATVVEKIESESNEEAYVSKIVEIFAGNNAKVDYGNVQMLDKNAFLFTRKRATTGKDSLINWLDCNFGSSITLSEVTTNLDGEGSATNNYGIFFGNEGQQFDLVANSIHNAPNTVSDIFTKGALTDKAKCIYRGLVKIQRNASGSNGYQKEDTLLLSPNAAADSIPDLEIDNSDVRCTHGASIGRIDREKLFYLKSRGLDEHEATKLYVKGFFEELIQKMKIEKLRGNMHDLVDERMQ